VEKLFVVGKYLTLTEEGAVWEFEGVYDNKEVAEEACLSAMYFVGPADLNKVIGGEVYWPDMYYPLSAKQEEESDEI
jgi:hypothetical protein